MSINGKVKESFAFSNAREVRDFLNGFNDRKLEVMYMEDSNGNPLVLQYIENDMEDGSYTHDLRVA